MSYISFDSDLSGPRLGHVWRANDGAICGSVHLSRVRSSSMVFDSPEDARAAAAACLEAAEAMERLAEETSHDQLPELASEGHAIRPTLRHNQ